MLSSPYLSASSPICVPSAFASPDCQRRRRSAFQQNMYNSPPSPPVSWPVSFAVSARRPTRSEKKRCSRYHYSYHGHCSRPRCESSAENEILIVVVFSLDPAPCAVPTYALVLNQARQPPAHCFPAPIHQLLFPAISRASQADALPFVRALSFPAAKVMSLGKFGHDPSIPYLNGAVSCCG